MELKLKWPVGQHIVQSLDFKMKSEITVPKQPAPIKQDMTIGQSYALSVLKETPMADMKWNWNSSACG